MILVAAIALAGNYYSGSHQSHSMELDLQRTASEDLSSVANSKLPSLVDEQRSFWKADKVIAKEAKSDDPFEVMRRMKKGKGKGKSTKAPSGGRQRPLFDASGKGSKGSKSQSKKKSTKAPSGGRRRPIFDPSDNGLSSRAPIASSSKSGKKQA